MKKLNLNFLIFIILFSVLFGCTQESKETDVEGDIAAIKELYNQYCIAVSASDLDHFMSFPTIARNRHTTCHWKKPV